jgi:23S rRNA (cytosine1962-C5)-methyltransferase
VPGAGERVEQRLHRLGQPVEHETQCTLRGVLRFRAPGTSLSALALVERALGVAEPRTLRAESRGRAAALVRGGALALVSGGAGRSAPARKLSDPEAPVEPGAVLLLDARAPAAVPAAAPRWRALAPAPPWREGRAAGFAFATLEERAGVALLALAPGGGSPDALRAWLASAGSALLGDVEHGGILVAGGLRLFAAAEEPRWPEEAVFPPERSALRISAATARALARGHPWVIPDRETERGDRFAPGALVTLATADGRGHGLARAEGAKDLAARLWAAGGSRPASLEARVARALARRGELLEGARSDAYRLVHGEADALPGLAVDRLGPLLRVLVTGRAALPLRERVLAALRGARLPGLAADAPLVEVMHLRERPPGELLCVRLAAGDAASIPEPLVVREGALRFRVDVGLGAPARPRPAVGFFLDQRANRARVAERAGRGGRYLNLFAHTGGFSAALLAGGAGEVWSVDLSAPWLAWLEENLKLSALPLERHLSFRREARRFLAELEPGVRFAGIVVDPPTAAAAGRRFWSTRRDLAPLAEAALARLEPGGFLLLTRQERARRGGLEALLTSAAASARVRIASLDPAPPDVDFPRLAGFPEGAPFEAVLATRA